jgi:hypothetical protein
VTGSVKTLQGYSAFDICSFNSAILKAEAGYGGVDWINLTQHRDHLRDFVTMVTYIPFSSKMWNLFSTKYTYKKE